MTRRGIEHDGRSSDLDCRWMVETLGSEWEEWRKLASEWLASDGKSYSDRIAALIFFFSKYLNINVKYASDVPLFFSGYRGHRCSSDEMIKAAKVTITAEDIIAKRVNKACDFIDFVISRRFMEPNDDGTLVATMANPLSRVKSRYTRTETVRNPLPYRYIQELRQIICPLPNTSETEDLKASLAPGEELLPSYRYRHFKDWTWAQKQTGDGSDSRGGTGDWFDVSLSSIDKSDNDCVWRAVKRNVNGTNKKVYQIWSPVRSVLIFLKLHLPLRTYQVRMLDSGEADTWRYEQGQWVLNTKHDFALGSKNRPFGKGVFRRIHDTMTSQYSTGLHINTNKTADQNKGELERGYVIPWQNEEVLYWMEKLRDWQEKYNPISKPTDCLTLLPKHTGAKKSNQQLSSMGEVSFLFRDASATGDDKHKPICDNNGIGRIWYALLSTLEDKLFKQGVTLDNKERLKLVYDYPEDTAPSSKITTHFPLHSLRVSLITAYTMDTQLPLPVISKLLAGHSRLLMTIYYNKITPSAMAEKMDQAETQLDNTSRQSVRNFLKNESMEQIQCKMVYNHEEGLKAALASRNPIGWEERATGLCLVGGNTVESDSVSGVGGCWNGGPLVANNTNVSKRKYGSVPHGPENCVRCRWFVTEARYLPALNAHFNQLSYKAHQAANLSVEIEGDLEALEDKQFFFEEEGKPFTEHGELQALQRRYEKQQVETDEYAKDWIACFELIQKIIRVEELRTDDDTKDKLIAVGAEQDVSYALKFVETESELLHLSLLCDDAEFFPDLQDEIRKTPAIQKRSMQLSRVLMKRGFEPIFLGMDEKTQLITANAMLRHMAKIADPDDKLEGYRKVANYIEAGDYLKEHKLFNAGMSALTDKALNLEGLTQRALLES